MMELPRVLFLVTSLVAMAASAPSPFKVIDLTYKLQNSTIFWPYVDEKKVTPFRHTREFLVDGDDFYMEAYDISSTEHMGTHMDSPSHYGKGKITMDQIPLEKVIGYAVVVNMTAKVEKDPDAQLMVSDIEAWEREHGIIPDDSIFLLHTGLGKYWGDAVKYFGGDGKNISTFQFPGIHIDAAKWLVKNRKMKTYGVECISLDYAPSVKFEVHTFLAENNIPGIENAANLDKLPAKGAFVFAAPMKIAGGSGASVRLLATISKQPQTCGGMSAGSQVAIVSFFVSLTTMLSMFA